MTSRWKHLLDPDLCAHRPYPVPERPWALRMGWRDLLFAHWRCPAAAVDALLPDAIELDVRDGAAWVGVVPFRMVDTAPRGLPALPGRPSAFLELNVRTYVRHAGRPGVWFFSLDAESPLAVRLARWTFRLPYHDARMSCTPERDGWIHYRSERRHRGVGAGRFDGRYRPVGPVLAPARDDLAAWLTERYFLAVTDAKGRLRLGEIHHPPWPLRAAEAEIATCTVAEAFGIDLPDEPPLLHYADSLDVIAWLPKAAGRADAEADAARPNG